MSFDLNFNKIFLAALLKIKSKGLRTKVGKAVRLDAR